MDDVKLFGKNKKEIESLMNTVRIFSEDKCMEFGIDTSYKYTSYKYKYIVIKILVIKILVINI